MVARGLREAIVEGRLQPGDRIKEDVVAGEYGVSRSPVREAVRELASEGLVTLERDVGARVTRIDLHELEQLYLAREAIEPILIAESTLRITEEELARARELNERAEQLARDGEFTSYLKLDAEMHLLLLHASRLDVLCEIAATLWQRTARHRIAYTQPDRMELSALEHRMLLDAIARRAPEDAADLYRVHTRHTRVTLMKANTPEEGSSQ